MARVIERRGGTDARSTQAHPNQELFKEHHFSRILGIAVLKVLHHG